MWVKSGNNVPADEPLVTCHCVFLPSMSTGRKRYMDQDLATGHGKKRQASCIYQDVTGNQGWKQGQHEQDQKMAYWSIYEVKSRMGSYEDKVVWTINLWDYFTLLLLATFTQWKHADSDYWHQQCYSRMHQPFSTLIRLQIAGTKSSFQSGKWTQQRICVPSQRENGGGQEKWKKGKNHPSNPIRKGM